MCCVDYGRTNIVVEQMCFFSYISAAYSAAYDKMFTDRASLGLSALAELQVVLI